MQKIYTLSQYAEIVEKNYKKIKSEEDRKDVLAFRGQASRKFELVPYFGRYGVEKEREIIQLAKTSYPTTFQDGYSPLVLLSLLQHYGIPTRLLDITRNALVGLYFACNEHTDEDGEVYIFRHKEKLPEDNAVENVIAASYNLLHPSVPEMPVETFCKNAAKMYGSEFAWLDGDPAEYIRNKMSHICFVRLPHLIYRQTVQSGDYILFSNNIKNENIVPEIRPIPENDPHIAEKIIIAANAKKTLLAELEYFGITEMALFPENIDKGCRWLTAKLN